MRPYKVVNVLGTPYTIYIDVTKADKPLLDEVDGYCDTTTKEIFVAKFEASYDSLQDPAFYVNKVLRHELVHAFLYESGLDVSSHNGWARDEEIVDWIAFQLEKIAAAVKYVKI